MIRENLARFVAFLPALALAHPGHYHPPGEDDEFDQFRADYLHLHGFFEVGLAALLIASLLVFHFNKSRKVRMGAVVAFGSSLALLAAF